jgi:hypothetical protein
MSIRLEGAVNEALGRDMELAAALAALDPGSHEPTYWARFGDWVMSEAGAELTRRRSARRVTVADVLSSWARTVVPTALAAAAVAGLVLLRAAPPIPGPEAMGVEELLVSDLEGLTIPSLLSPESPVNSASFLSEIF